MDAAIAQTNKLSPCGTNASLLIRADVGRHRVDTYLHDVLADVRDRVVDGRHRLQRADLGQGDGQAVQCDKSVANLLNQVVLVDVEPLERLRLVDRLGQCLELVVGQVAHAQRGHAREEVGAQEADGVVRRVQLLQAVSFDG